MEIMIDFDNFFFFLFKSSSQQVTNYSRGACPCSTEEENNLFPLSFFQFILFSYQLLENFQINFVDMRHSGIGGSILIRPQTSVEFI